MRNLIYWDGPGHYASRGRSWPIEIGGGNYTETIKVDSPTPGYGTPRWIGNKNDIPDDMEIIDRTQD
jgi:hypothetical protein